MGIVSMNYSANWCYVSQVYLNISLWIAPRSNFLLWVQLWVVSSEVSCFGTTVHECQTIGNGKVLKQVHGEQAVFFAQITSVYLSENVFLKVHSFLYLHKEHNNQTLYRDTQELDCLCRAERIYFFPVPSLLKAYSPAQPFHQSCSTEVLETAVNGMK